MSIANNTKWQSIWYKKITFLLSELNLTEWLLNKISNSILCSFLFGLIVWYPNKKSIKIYLCSLVWFALKTKI